MLRISFSTIIGLYIYRYKTVKKDSNFIHSYIFCELVGVSHDMIFIKKKSASVYLLSKTLKVAISLMCT